MPTVLLEGERWVTLSIKVNESTLSGDDLCSCPGCCKQRSFPTSSPNATTYTIWIDVLKLADTTLPLPFTDSCDPAPLSERSAPIKDSSVASFQAPVRLSVRHPRTRPSLAPSDRWRRERSGRSSRGGGGRGGGGNIQIIAWCLGSSSPDVIMPNSLLIIKNKLKNIWRLEMRGPPLKYLMCLINDTISLE